MRNVGGTSYAYKRRVKGVAGLTIIIIINNYCYEISARACVDYHVGQLILIEIMYKLKRARSVIVSLAL